MLMYLNQHLVPFVSPDFLALLPSLAGVCVGAILTLLGTRFSLRYYFKEELRKTISYKIIADTPITNALGYNDLNLLILKIWNSGNTEVKSSDLTEAIVFGFKGRKLVGASMQEIRSKKPIPPHFDTNQQSIQFSSFSLNPEDSVTVSILLVGSKDTIIVSGTLSDTEINEEK